MARPCGGIRTQLFAKQKGVRKQMLRAGIYSEHSMQRNSGALATRHPTRPSKVSPRRKAGFYFGKRDMRTQSFALAKEVLTLG